VSVQHLLWNDLILLAAIDRYRRADGAVASFRPRPPSAVNRFGISEEALVAHPISSLSVSIRYLGGLTDYIVLVQGSPF